MLVVDARQRFALLASLAACAVAFVFAMAGVACSAKNAPSAAEDASAAPIADASGADVVAPAVVDAGEDAITDAAALLDAPDVRFNYDDCTNTDFDTYDETAHDASRTIVFSFHANPIQYAPRCMKIRQSQTVTWQGDFADHPLVSAGGDVPSPINGVMPTATTGAVTFPKAGWFGFECAVHESPTEYGAVLVVP